MAWRILFLLVLTLAACQSAVRPSISHRFENGRWYQDGVFVRGAVNVIDGTLQFGDSKGPLIDASTEIIDMEDGYVVPPFCEAHNHNLGSGFDGVDETIDAYLQDGVFYVMIAGSFPVYRQAIIDKLNKPDSIDVVFANNGLTGSGGHPRGLREFLMDRFGLYPEFTKETLPDHGYFEADTSGELQEKWALILANRPDFIKAMLYYSEEFETRKNDPEYYGRRGLDPNLLPVLVRLAHAENLRLMVHVESDHDMAVALNAGTDIIGHLVSHDAPLRISDETVALAGAKGVPIVTTASIAKRSAQRAPDRYSATVAAQAANLRRLHEAGANLVMGSDNSLGTSLGEADHLASLQVFDNAMLLKMWTENCARTVFPDRAIGKLDDGYDASFLVLGGDPLADFKHTRNIKLRVKNGAILY